MIRTRSLWSYAFLCAMPFLAAGLTARPLRILGLHQAIGVIHFLVIAVAAWNVGLRAIPGGPDERRRLALCAALLLLPFSVVALLWVGLGTPWEATPEENRMRYLVLLGSSVAVGTAFVLMWESLREAGERLYSTLGLAGNVLAAATYVVWNSAQVGLFVDKLRDGQVSNAVIEMSNLFDILLFAACAMTYLAVGAFAAAMGRAGWLGRNATRVYVAINLIAFGLLCARGLAFPVPTGDSEPWYTQPGFIVGIPAVPWIMPALLGVVLLRKAGDAKHLA